MNDPVIERVAREDPADRQPPPDPTRTDAILGRVLAAAEQPDAHPVGGDRRLRVIGGVAGPALAITVALIVAGVIITLAGHHSRSMPIAQPAGSPVPATFAGTARAGRGAQSLLSADGSVWVAGGRRVTRLDPATGRVQARISVAANSAGAQMTAGAGSIWATNLASSTVVRIDPHTNRVTATFHLDGSGNGGGIGFMDGDVRVSRDAGGRRDGVVVAIDPRTGHLVGFAARVGTGPARIAAGLGSLWVQDTSPPHAGITQITPGGAPRLLSRLRGTPFIGLGSLWVTPDPLDDQSTSILRYDPATGQVVAQIPAPRASAIAFGHGRAWVLSTARSRSSRTFQPIAGTATLTQIDPRTNQTVGAPIHLSQAQPTSLAIHHDNLWIATANGLLLHFTLGGA